jgi:hypothetical protein
MALVLVLGAGFPAGPSTAQSSGDHPDLSGIYFPAGFARRTPNPLPFTPEAQQMADDYRAEFEAEDNPGRFCIWPGMPRAPWGAPFPLEVFQMDHEIAIYWEGYGMFRKIYMADHNPPDAILNTAMGHSLAHWEGDTLVVETTHLKAYPYFSSLPNTSNAHVSERIQLVPRTVNGKDTKFLVDDITLTDPQLYTEPVLLHAEAELRPDLFLLEYTCTDTIWENYLAEQGLTVPDVDSLPEE